MLWRLCRVSRPLILAFCLLGVLISGSLFVAHPTTMASGLLRLHTAYILVLIISPYLILAGLTLWLARNSLAHCLGISIAALVLVLVNGLTWFLIIDLWPGPLSLVIPVVSKTEQLMVLFVLGLVLGAISYIKRRKA